MLKKVTTHKDGRGLLGVIDFKDVPFDVKRAFYITDVPYNTLRGDHAHKECLQMFVCLSGRVDVYIDKGDVQYKSYYMEAGDTLFIDKWVWSELHFLVKNTVLLVLCSHEYDENDYIRGHKEFWDAVELKNNIA